MQLSLLKTKIHRATVTHSELNYEGSIAIDGLLLEASGIREFEQVHVWDVTNGSRFTTYALRADEGSGVISLNGGAARHVQVGDLVIIAAFAGMSEQERPRSSPPDYVDAQTASPHQPPAPAPHAAASVGRAAVPRRAPGGVTLSSLVNGDAGRAGDFALRQGALYVNFARQSYDREAFAALLDLARSRDLSGAFRRLFDGEQVNVTEGRAALHTALRGNHSGAAIARQARHRLRSARAHGRAGAALEAAHHRHRQRRHRAVPTGPRWGDSLRAPYGAASACISSPM